jgi:hypothetical protein
LGGIFSCFFKDENIKGQCDGECKDGTPFHGWAWDVPACQQGCNDFCDPDHGGVFSCYFKDENVKGCDAVCKDGSHVKLQAADPKECLQVCADACPAGEYVGCYFDGERARADIPAVSEWGLVVMALLVVSAATVVIQRHRKLRTT